MSDEMMTASEAERRRLAFLSAESDDHDIIQVEVLYRTKWRRFEISSLEVQHLPPMELWDRYLAPTLKAVGAPDRVLADPDIPEPSQVDGADIVVGDSVS